MPVIYSTGAKNAQMTAIRDACADGTLELLTSADAALVAAGLSASGGTVTSGVWTLAFDGPATATAAGTAVKARIKNASGTVVVSGLTVGMTNAFEVRPDNTSIAAGQTVTFGTVTLAHAADPV